MSTVIKSGDTTIIASGTAISYNGQPIEISFPTSANDSITIVFKFDKDDSGKPSLKAIAPNSKKLELTLFNFNNSLGQGNTKPLEIAETDHKKIFLNFRVYSLDETSSKTLHFTFYKND